MGCAAPQEHDPGPGNMSLQPGHDDLCGRRDGSGERGRSRARAGQYRHQHVELPRAMLDSGAVRDRVGNDTIKLGRVEAVP